MSGRITKWTHYWADALLDGRVTDGYVAERMRYRTDA